MNVRALLLALLLLAACGGDAQPALPPSDTGQSAAAVELPIVDPRPPVTSVVTAEVLSSGLTDWLGQLGDHIQVRDFAGLRGAFGEGFLGRDPLSAPVSATHDLPLGAQRVELDTSGARLVDADALVESIAARLGPWRRVEDVHWSVARAEFAPPQDGDTWGAADVALHLVGEDARGGREALDLGLRLRVQLTQGRWTIARWSLLAGEVLTQAEPLFVDVSLPAGVHFEGARFGQPGNDSDGWSGAACGDVDGDGRWDLFLPGPTRSFLYLGQESGGFQDEAAARGLGAEVGGTGVLLFDYDNDGDQDLAVAHVGWRELDETPRGKPLALYENDGAGHFTEVGAALGLALYLPAYSLVAFDADGDGWTDLFVCGYGRMEDEPNDSWMEALNGASDRLLRNLDGAGFEDVTRAAGLRDRSWSYAAAAADFDRDGDQDLYVANNFGSNRLWRNRGDGTFEDAAKELSVAAPGITFGCAWADLDGDGRLDLYLTRPSSTTGNRILARLEDSAPDTALAGLAELASGNQVLLGRAEGAFVQAELAGTGKAGWSWTPVCADFDLDGRLDVYCVNGFVTGDLPQDT